MGSLWALILVLGAPTPLRLTADADDAYALRFNPGGLAQVTQGELRLLYARDQNVNGFGAYGGVAVVDGLVLGAGFDIDVDPQFSKAAHTGVLGMAVGDRTASVGMTWERVSPFEGPAKSLVSAGLSLRFTRWLAMGLAVRDLAQRVDRRQWDVGLAFRPFGERFLLSSRWRVRQSAPINRDTLDLALLATAEPFDGVTVGVAGDLDLNFTFLLSLNLIETLTTGAAVTTDGDQASVAAEVVYHADRRPAVIRPARVAVVHLSGALVPEPEVSLLTQSVEVTPYGQAPLILDALRRSDRVEGVFARIGPLDVGWAKAEEIRQGFVDLKTSGRRVDCYLSGASDRSFLVASACSSVAVAPAMNLRMDGVSAEVMFFGDGLEQLGVDVDVARRGDYKNSPDQFTRAGMSTAQREALSAYLDTVFDVLLSGVAEGRGLDKKQVRALVDMGTLTATEAVERGLVDAVLYPDELDDHLERLYQRPVSPASGIGRFDPVRARWASRPRIAVVHVDATITGGESSDLPFGLGRSVGAGTLIRALEQARTDDDVIAVVLRVDSPGGDAFASDLIARAVTRLQKVKPVVASLGDVAASGGYYVAAPAGSIYAEPTTLTGSIGVYAMSVSAQALLSKLGVQASSIERGQFSNAESLFSPWSPATRTLAQKGVDDAYRLFLQVVAKGRNLSLSEARKVAEGRVWSGRDAKSKGLVDELGGLLAAIRRAKIEAGFEPGQPVEVVHLPSRTRGLTGLVRFLAETLAPAGATEPGGVIFPHRIEPLRRWAGQVLLTSSNALSPQAVLPFQLVVD